MYKRGINNFPLYTYTYVPGYKFISSVAQIGPKRPFRLKQKQAETCYTDYEPNSSQPVPIYSSSPEDVRIALALLAGRKVRVDGLISHRPSLERFAGGVTLMQQRAALKVYFQITGEN